MRSILTLLLLFPAVGRADPARRDLYGDPLPEGAIQRLGTGRLAHPKVQRLTVTEDDETVVTVGYDGFVRFWSARTGTLRRVSRIPCPYPDPERVSEDGLRAIERHQTAIRVWDVETGKILREIDLPKGATLGQVAFAPDPNQVATVDANEGNHRIRVWDLNKGVSEVVGKADCRSSEPWVFLNSSLLAPTGLHAPQQVWDVQKKKAAALPGSPARRPATQRKSGVIALIDKERGVWHLWDLAEGRSKWQKPFPPEGTAVLLSPDREKYLLQTGQDFEVRTVEDDRVLYRGAISSTSVGVLVTAFSADSGCLFVYDQSLQKVDLKTGTPLWPRYLDSPREVVHEITWLSDSRHLASREEGGAAIHRVWDTKRARHEASWTGTEYESAAVHLTESGFDAYFVSEGVLMQGHFGRNESAPAPFAPLPFDEKDIDWRSPAVSPDGSRLVVFGTREGEGLFGEVDLRTKRVVKRARLLNEALPNSKGFDCFSRDARVFHFWGSFYRLPEAEPLPPMADDPGYYPVRPATTPSADLFAAVVERPLSWVRGQERVSRATALVVWERCTGREVLRLADVAGDQPTFHPSGRFLALPDTRGIRIWNLVTGEVVRRLEPDDRRYQAGVYGSPTRLAFSLDGTRLATGHADTTILIWDTSDLPPLPRERLDAATVERLWAALREPDAKAAQDGVWRLAGSPETVLPFLKARLRPVAAITPAVSGPILKQLRSDNFRQREAAMKKLGEFEDGVLSLLDEQVEASADVRQRLAALPEKHAWKIPPVGEDLRLMRAVRLLETIGGPEALKLVESLAGGLPSARATQEAVAARERMRHWPSPKPNP